MNEKIYCFQCHNSVYVNTTNFYYKHPLFGERICLYCYKQKRYFTRTHLINSCPSFNPESREKLIKGIWRANVANRSKPG